MLLNFIYFPIQTYVTRMTICAILKRTSVTLNYSSWSYRFSGISRFWSIALLFCSQNLCILWHAIVCQSFSCYLSYNIWCATQTHELLMTTNRSLLRSPGPSQSAIDYSFFVLLLFSFSHLMQNKLLSLFI